MLFCAWKECGHLNAWLPSDMLHHSPRTADQFAQEYDRHGDSYTQSVTTDSLKEVFNNVQAQVNTEGDYNTSQVLIALTCSTHKSNQGHGGSLGEWLGRRTCDPVVPGSSPALTATWSCFTADPSSTPQRHL